MSNLYQQFLNRPLSNKIFLVVAFLGSLLTLVQIVLLENGLDGICFSGGCEIVDNQTKVSPVIFNFFGLVFFQIVFWGNWAGRRSKELQFYVSMLLLAALVAEGALVSFQYFIVETFCTYCLIIFSLVVLLNALNGLHHALTGAAIFFATVIAFSSLQFEATPDISATTGIRDLNKGSYAVLLGDENKPKLSLFFSSTCPHCERVIKSLQQGTSCEISFNPVSTVSNFPITTSMTNDQYDIGVNRAFMNSLGQKSIPVLLVEQKRHIQLLSGGNAIIDYLKKSCS